MSIVKRRLGSRQVARTLGLTILVIGLGTSTVVAQAKTTLRWKFTAGEVLHYSLEQTTVNTGQDPSGREVKRTIALNMDMTWTIKSVDASGLATWTQTIDRVRVSVTAPGNKISSDSQEAGDADGPFAAIFKILVGAEFHSQMNPRGELTEIKLSDKLLATLGGNEGGGPKGQFSEAGLKNMLTQMVVTLPEAGVVAGETWQRKLIVPTDVDGQTRPIEQVFTYQGPVAGSTGWEAIEFTTRMEPRKPDPRVPLVYKKEITTGRFDFDNAAGRIAKSTSTDVVEVSMSVQGKEIPEKQETSRTLILSKDKSP